MGKSKHSFLDYTIQITSNSKWVSVRYLKVQHFKYSKYICPSYKGMNKMENWKYRENTRILEWEWEWERLDWGKEKIIVKWNHIFWKIFSFHSKSLLQMDSQFINIFKGLFNVWIDKTYEVGMHKNPEIRIKSRNNFPVFFLF